MASVTTRDPAVEPNPRLARVAGYERREYREPEIALRFTDDEIGFLQDVVAEARGQFEAWREVRAPLFSSLAEQVAQQFASLDALVVAARQQLVAEQGRGDQ